jgi:hypothetical protein
MAPIFLMEVSGQLHVTAALPSGERALSAHRIGGWVGPRAGLDTAEKRKILYCREPKPGRQACSPSLHRLT